MANLKISQLPVKTTLGSTDLIPIVDESGTPTTSQITARNLFIGKGQSLYIASSTSSTSQKLIADYVCTGTNDHVMINSAIAALPSGGGKIFLFGGTYNLGGTINIVVPYTELRGQGWSTILKINNSANIYAITYNPGSSVRMDGCVIADLKIDCNATNQSGTSGGINAFGAAYNVFEHLWIKSPYTYGLSLHQDNLGGFGHHNNVRACWFNLGTDSPANIGVGLHITSSDENVISGTIFESNGGTADSASQLFEDSGLQVITDCIFVANPNVASVEHIKHGGGNGSIISGCTFDGGTNAQVELSSYDTVTGCNFFQPISQKYCILAGNTGCTITGNIFTSSATINASGGAVDASAGAGNIISNNIVHTMGAWNNSSIMNVGTGNYFINNYNYNPAKSSQTAGSSPFTMPLLPYNAVYVITTTGGMTALTLDGQALFNGSFSVGQNVFVGANHTLIATWATTAPVFEILPQ